RAGRGAAAASRAGREVAPDAEVEAAPPGVTPPSDVEQPVGADSPIDPASPPPPKLAPWGGKG
ncbi:MAG TPA: hypothetical protein VIV57_09225, partial [Anaeromyxobacter sp.]